MSDSWIVTAYEYVPHDTYDRAEQERARLTEKTGKTFRVRRVKSALNPTGNYDLFRKALEQIERLYPNPEPPKNACVCPPRDLAMALIAKWAREGSSNG